MHLKSIEVHGFKSFANKIVLEFHDGITGIVGPNGSGKSNVADAVRWVLGEQSAKQLRGAKMEDVIFSGTQARKPLGFAYVAITLDNSDHKLPIEFDEVTVARRVYRSGESEYLINGSSCRLKDVQELFMDTGIGKEGYSIIGQGQIDKILSGKPEERRELFDEAAGIVKFKRRKAAAEKHLDEERLNLSRITDIIKEIEKQLVPLEKQSAVAKVYLKYKEELKEFEIAQFLKEYDKIRESKEQVEQNLNLVNEDLEATRRQYENTKEEYLRLEQQLEAYDLSMNQDKSNLSNLLLQKEKAEGEIKVLKEQINSLSQNDKYYQSRMEQSDKDIEQKKLEEQKYLSEKDKIDDKLSTMDDLLSDALAEVASINEQIQSNSNEIEQCNNQIFQSLTSNAQIKASMERYETMLEQNNLRKSELNQRILKNKSIEEAHNQAIDSYRAQLDQSAAIIASLNKQNTEAEQALKEIQASLDQNTTEYNHVQNLYLREKSRYESLVNLTERYEGYGQSIKKIMEQKTKVPGILGVVADIIKTEKEYETAMETALGGSIQNVVTEDENSAKELITYLKQNKFGRATFLPLTNISSGNTFMNEKALKETGVIGIASDLVHYDAKFKSLIDFLLGRILVVDHMNHATVIARKYNYSLRIVTLDGELLTAGGSISGGAYKNNSNLLGRRREIEELENEIKAFESNLKEITIRNEISKKKKNSLREEQENIRSLIQKEYLTQNTAKMSLESEIAKKEESQLVFLEYNNELREIENQAWDLNNNLNHLQLSLTENLEKNKLVEARIDALNQENKAKKDTLNLASEKAASLKLELSSLEQNNQFLLENIRRVKRELERLNEDKSRLIQDIENAAKVIDEKKDAILAEEQKVSEYILAIEALNQKIQIQTQERDEITKQHKNFFAKRDELSTHINHLDKEAFRLNSQKEKLLEQADLQMSYMWEEYELTYTSALEHPIDENLTLSQVKKHIQDVKGKIRELGDVNVNAIEEYKSVSERYAFLTEQSEDLIRSEAALLKIIEELDTEMRRTFALKFEAINQQFDLVFRELFGGGKAYLELTEDEDILEAGIRINGQPPGKKLQNMMQLSGGEKALTAISLLFAIQNLKPSPFCLLDEIEAALDDSNVKRYANYLHKLSKDTQFIIITHRRGTMAAADILYGITMQEKGISTLVSVNLIENELDI